MSRRVLLIEDDKAISTVIIAALREEIAEWWKVPFERDYRVPGLDNSIMPWKIARDGSVSNGLA